MTARTTAVRGTVREGFEPVREQLEEFVAADPDYNAQLCAYWRGAPAVDLVVGAAMSADSITGVFSATKGVAALVVADLVDRGQLDIDACVASYWPEFAAGGKGEVTVRQLLSHQAGLVGTRSGFTAADMCDSRAMADELAHAVPAWRPGTCFGYHAATMGVFIEELVRRVTTGSVQEYYTERIRDPYGIDFFMGSLGTNDERYRDLLPALAPSREEAERIRPVEPDSLRALSLATDRREATVAPPAIAPNMATIRASGPAAMGGVGSAHGLARVYAAATTGVDGRNPFVSASTIALVSQQQSWGVDRLLNVPMCFAVVFMKPHHGSDFASYTAFGHNGFGGAWAFADPLHELAFGYVPQRISIPGGPDKRALQLSRTVRTVISGLAS